MATITLAQAALQSQNQLEAGIIDTMLVAAPALGLLPITTVSGNALAYNRLVKDVSAHFVAADGTITDSDAAEIKQVIARIGTMSAQGDVPNAMIRQGIGGGDELRAQVIRSAVRSLSKSFLTFMISGTVATNGFDGLDAILASGDFEDQVVTGGSDFLADIDEASTRVLVPGQQIIMGNAKAEVAFKRRFRDLGGANITEVNGQIFSAYDGKIFLRNDYIPTTGSTTDVYIMTLGDGMVNGGAVNFLTTPGELFVLEGFDYLEMKSASRDRVLMDMGLAVGNPQSIAVVRDIAV